MKKGYVRVRPADLDQLRALTPIAYVDACTGAPIAASAPEPGGYADRSGGNPAAPLRVEVLRQEGCKGLRYFALAAEVAAVAGFVPRLNLRRWER